MMATNADTADTVTKTTSHCTKRVVIAEEVTPRSEPTPTIALSKQITANDESETIADRNLS